MSKAVKCINNDKYEDRLTVGGYYIPIKIYSVFMSVTDDLGRIDFYERSKFNRDDIEAVEKEFDKYVPTSRTEIVDRIIEEMPIRKVIKLTI